ncbi:hypothetical protein C8Q76DRAFT_488593 [Earliella scabrosa]|nr:hypothetical protein C8Q76DRAFT_488593 [Earliella scabrosa]
MMRSVVLYRLAGVSIIFLQLATGLNDCDVRPASSRLQVSGSFVQVQWLHVDSSLALLRPAHYFQSRRESRWTLDTSRGPRDRDAHVAPPANLSKHHGFSDSTLLLFQLADAEVSTRSRAPPQFCQERGTMGVPPP